MPSVCLGPREFSGMFKNNTGSYVEELEQYRKMLSGKEKEKGKSHYLLRKVWKGKMYPGNYRPEQTSFHSRTTAETNCLQASVTGDRCLLRPHFLRSVWFPWELVTDLVSKGDAGNFISLHKDFGSCLHWRCLRARRMVQCIRISVGQCWKLFPGFPRATPEWKNTVMGFHKVCPRSFSVSLLVVQKMEEITLNS